jgi:hypothetical protein
VRLSRQVLFLKDGSSLQARKKNAEEKLQLLNKLLHGIKTGLEKLTAKLYVGENGYFTIPNRIFNI